MVGVRVSPDWMHGLTIYVEVKRKDGSGACYSPHHDPDSPQEDLGLARDDALRYLETVLGKAGSSDRGWVEVDDEVRPCLICGDPRRPDEPIPPPGAGTEICASCQERLLKDD